MPTPLMRFAGNVPFGSATLAPSQASQPENRNQTPPTPVGQPYYYWQNQFSQIPTGRIMNNLGYAQQFGEEILPIVAPRMAAATPIISSAFAGYTVYDTFRREYRNSKDLPPEKRYKKMAIKAGDLTLFHLFSSLLIPMLLARQIKAVFEKSAKSGWLPRVMANHLNFVTALAIGASAIVISKPVNKVVNFVLDWTYRPLMEKHKRKKWEKFYREQLPAYYARAAALRRYQAQQMEAQQESLA